MEQARKRKFMLAREMEDEDVGQPGRLGNDIPPSFCAWTMQMAQKD
jgi:hypothetical protein